MSPLLPLHVLQHQAQRCLPWALRSRQHFQAPLLPLRQLQPRPQLGHGLLQLRHLPQQLRSLRPPPARQEGTSIPQCALSTGTGILSTAGRGTAGRGDVVQGHLHGRLLGTQLADGLTQGPLL